jgi:hypothetical protein
LGAVSWASIFILLISSISIPTTKSSKEQRDEHMRTKNLTKPKEVDDEKGEKELG